MTKLIRTPKLKGVIDRHDPLHGPEAAATGIAPSYVTVPDGSQVPQYSETVVGTSTKYDPQGNCDGNFMSYKFQVNNNCYNYSTNVATNSFAQPGRMTGHEYTQPPTGGNSTQVGSVVYGAVQDGLVDIGTEITASDIETYTDGHFVALLISESDESVGWPGDYHWVRCDSIVLNADEIAGSPVYFSTWSQKDGSDQVTNFDFAGKKITDPATANWTVNQGPLTTAETDDYVVTYKFHTYMFVPNDTITII